jgi:hypothetical protein
MVYSGAIGIIHSKWRDGNGWVIDYPQGRILMNPEYIEFVSDMRVKTPLKIKRKLQL